MNKCHDKKVEKLFNDQLTSLGYTGTTTWQTLSEATRQRWRDWYTKQKGKLEEK